MASTQASPTINVVLLHRQQVLRHPQRLPPMTLNQGTPPIVTTIMVFPAAQGLVVAMRFHRLHRRRHAICMAIAMAIYKIVLNSRMPNSTSSTIDIAGDLRLRLILRSDRCIAIRVTETLPGESCRLLE